MASQAVVNVTRNVHGLVSKIRDERDRINKRNQEKVDFEKGLDLIRSELRTESEKMFKGLESDLQSVTEQVNALSKQPNIIVDPDSTLRDIPISKLVSTNPIIFGKKAEIVREVQKLNDVMHMTAHLKNTDVRNLEIYKSFISKSGHSTPALLGKAIADVAGFGQDWFPTEYSSEFIDRMEGNYEVLGTFPRKVTIPQGVDRIRIPGVGAAMRMYKMTSSSQDDVNKITASTFGTRYVELDPVSFGALIEIEEGAIEDSVVSLAEFAIADLELTAARDQDDLVINGDTASTHQDSDVTLAADHRKAISGLRILTPSASKIDASNAGLTTDMTRRAITTMKSGISRYGNVDDLIYLVSLEGYWHLLILAENLTREKRGELATIDTGVLTRFMNIPVVQSSMVRSDLNASGVYDGVTMTRTEAIIYNKRAYVVGTKREVRIESERVLSVDRRRSVLTLRKDFKSMMPSGHPVASIIYNVKTTG